jgi:hypothetical protein
LEIVLRIGLNRSSDKGECCECGEEFHGGDSAGGWWKSGVAGMGGLHATAKSVGSGVTKDASSHCVLRGVEALVAIGVVESALQEDLATDELLLADGSGRDGSVSGADDLAGSCAVFSFGHLLGVLGVQLFAVLLTACQLCAGALIADAAANVVDSCVSDADSQRSGDGEVIG